VAVAGGGRQAVAVAGGGRRSRADSRERRGEAVMWLCGPLATGEQVEISGRIAPHRADSHR
jgi:hypothetical protein